jgi:hypothetical protein
MIIYEQTKIRVLVSFTLSLSLSLSLSSFIRSCVFMFTLFNIVFVLCLFCCVFVVSYYNNKERKRCVCVCAWDGIVMMDLVFWLEL